MKAKVLSVYDEGAKEGTPLIGSRGLAMIADVDGERTLFDTGLRGKYLMHNLENLGVEPDSVDRIVISHMHKGHTGGLETFLESRNEKTDVIMPPHPHTETGPLRFVRNAGMPKMSDEAQAKMNLITVNEWTQLSNSLFITGNIVNEGLVGNVNENALILMTKNGSAAICGCCHNGVSSLISYVEERTNKKVSAIIGGLHLNKMRRKDVHAVAETLTERGTPSLYLNHCTGYNQKMHLRERLGLKGVNDFYVGTEIHF